MFTQAIFRNSCVCVCDCVRVCVCMCARVGEYTHRFDFIFISSAFRMLTDEKHMMFNACPQILLPLILIKLDYIIYRVLA